MTNRWGNMETVRDFIFGGSKITADGDCSHEIKTLTPWKETYDQTRQHIKKQRHYFANKGLSSQSYGFSSNDIWMWELDYKKSWETKNWCFWLLRVPWTARGSNEYILKKSVLNVHWKDWSWSWNSASLATWCEELAHWKRPRFWERLKAGGEGD